MIAVNNRKIEVNDRIQQKFKLFCDSAKSLLCQMYLIYQNVTSFSLLIIYFVQVIYVTMLINYHFRFLLN